MAFSLGEPYPHLNKSGSVVWVKVRSSKHAKAAEKEVKANAEALSKKKVYINKGIGSAKISDIKARPYWVLAMNKVMNSQAQVNKIVQQAFNEVFK